MTEIEPLFRSDAFSADGCLYEMRSKVHFVDLAGSERFQEAFQPINSGLLALNNVTAALGDPRRKVRHYIVYKIIYWLLKN